jgi:phospholipid transport system substrate-binding protein
MATADTGIAHGLHRALACLVMLTLWVPGLRAQDEPTPDVAPPSAGQTARGYIEQTVETVTSILLDDQLEKPLKRARFQEIMAARLDIDEISRRVLRKSWEQWSLDQKKEFKQLFIQHLVSVYWQKVDSGFERIEMGEDEAEANIYWHVHTTVLVEKGANVSIEFILKKANDQADWKTIDLKIAGASQVSVFRDQFQPVVRSNGPDFLLDWLRKAVARSAAELEAEQEAADG